MQPEDGRFHWLLAVCDWTLGERDSVGQSLQTAVRLAPRLAQGQEALGHWYLAQGMVESALDASAKAATLAPQDAGIMASRAWVLEAAGELDQAWEILQRVIAANYAPTMVVSLYGRMARRRGEQQNAMVLVHQLLSSDKISNIDRAGLQFTAADLLDGLGRYDEAFLHAAHGNAMLRPTYYPEVHEASVDRLIQYFTSEKIRCLPRASYRSEKPVFIVGMPRSGSSLVEQILASHPQVFGAGELDFMFRVVSGTLDMLGAAEADYPHCLDGLSIDQANGMAQIYLEPLIALNPAAARITDKMPLNFLHLGVIQLLLPDARIIHCRRNPLDTCLSCHMTAFTTGNDFKYDLTHLGQFHRLQDRIMAHWKQVLDVPILDVQYEDVVADQEGQSRRMIEFIGLPWDDRCLQFHETRRSVATASVVQVRTPIYKSSLARWRNYEKHLGPLKAALGIED